MARSPWLGGLVFAGPVLIVVLVVVVTVNWPTETGGPARLVDRAGAAKDDQGDQPGVPPAAVTGDGNHAAEKSPAEAVQGPAPSDSSQSESPEVATPGGVADPKSEGTVEVRPGDGADHQPEPPPVEPPDAALDAEPESTAGEAAGAALGGGPDGALRERPGAVAEPEQEDKRLAEFRRIYQAVVAMFDDWKTQRDEQRTLEELLGPARADCTRLERQEETIRRGIISLNSDMATARREGNQEVIDILLTAIQNQQRELAALQAPLQEARARKLGLENQLAPVLKRRAHLSGLADQLGNEWLSLSDPFGKLSPAAHERAKGLFSEWIVEESELPLLYLARGFARLHTGEHDLALGDFERTAGFEQTGQIDPRMGALVRAAMGYTLSRKGDIRNGAAQFAQALKRDKRLAIIYVFRGHSSIAQERYLQAAGDFRKAVQLAEEAPETNEAYACLLATCPHETVRNGRKAIEHATTACELTEWKSWFCLDTLAAAYAEAGEFDTALKHATEALHLAPKDSQPGLRQKMSLYQAGKPFRMR